MLHKVQEFATSAGEAGGESVTQIVSFKMCLMARVY